MAGPACIWPNYSATHWLNDMKRTPVQSDYLHSVGYAPCASVLEIEFTEGQVFQYLDIPTSVYAALMASTTQAAFFREHIEPHHGFRQIGASPANLIEATLGDTDEP